MVSDELGEQLHDRATRGAALSAEEQAHLEGWYATQDRTEMDELGLTVAEETVGALQAQVESALAQLASVTKRIQQVADENEALRREIAVLRRQLVQQTPLQPI